MATDTATTSTEATPTMGSRQLNGTSFLTLEHVVYFVLVMLVPTLLVAGSLSAISMWSNGNDFMTRTFDLTSSLFLTGSGIPTTYLQTAAALLVFVPLLYVLRRRTAAEYVKRTGYTGRVAYKLPIYTALAVLVLAAAGSLAMALAVFLGSLTQIGVSGVDIGGMYVDEFLPALLAFVAYSATAWYVAWFAKGKDMSKLFVSLTCVLSAAVAVALFVTVLAQSHGASNPGTPSCNAGTTCFLPQSDGGSSSGSNLFNY